MPVKPRFLTGRGVAQPGSAPVLGTGGPRFESGRPDHSKAGLRFVAHEILIQGFAMVRPAEHLLIVLVDQDIGMVEVA